MSFVSLYCCLISVPFSHDWGLCEPWQRPVYKVNRDKALVKTKTTTTTNLSTFQNCWWSQLWHSLAWCTLIDAAQPPDCSLSPPSTCWRSHRRSAARRPATPCTSRGTCLCWPAGFAGPSESRRWCSPKWSARVFRSKDERGTYRERWFWPKSERHEVIPVLLWSADARNQVDTI